MGQLPNLNQARSQRTVHSTQYQAYYRVQLDRSFPESPRTSCLEVLQLRRIHLLLLLSFWSTYVNISATAARFTSRLHSLDSAQSCGSFDLLNILKGYHIVVQLAGHWRASPTLHHARSLRTINTPSHEAYHHVQLNCVFLKSPRTC